MNKFSCLLLFFFICRLSYRAMVRWAFIHTEIVNCVWCLTIIMREDDVCDRIHLWFGWTPDVWRKIIEWMKSNRIWTVEAGHFGGNTQNHWPEPSYWPFQLNLWHLNHFNPIIVQKFNYMIATGDKISDQTCVWIQAENGATSALFGRIWRLIENPRRSPSIMHSILI